MAGQSPAYRHAARILSKDLARYGSKTHRYAWQRDPLSHAAFWHLVNAEVKRREATT